ncbi:uncharacterized protein M421DRAFT_417554 [Didymella exigua CBS 183.55]|uniref:Uncharacterized protein n=1 Tax=Didymella exigua CBS 183.55 TaxID=1150837 RepID=A0A6A5RTJ2_9PLEO|nr:uncharacterized protein M421DRAFT_417554 [Didymella exigua CBS 183.55]KAF1931805.1 hypothetical protein M421DRAFT_417554 [Didymella exigua CBS 183.55]
MPAATRIPLAAVVCPSAPFLAPRLLAVSVSVPVCVCVPVSVPATALQRQRQHPQHPQHSQQRALSTTPQCADNAARGKKSGRSYFLEMRKREKQLANRIARRTSSGPRTETPPAVVGLALDMQQRLRDRDMDRIMPLYEPARDAGLIDSRATYAICQALHEAVRRDAARKDSSRLSTLLHFAAQLVADVQNRRIRPHNFAYVHLLSAYKDARHFAQGRDLWDWLRVQDDSHCSQGAYGAALELLSCGNLAALPELEALYQDGLQRYPGTFAAYHFSPDAVVPDRTQPVHIAGLPNTLFQGILTARLRAHDWTGAYLGLDTVLRLYPAQTAQRVFEMFVAERPLLEAYTAYMLACRSGVQLSGGQVTSVLNRLRVAMTQSPSLEVRFTLLRAMANALHAYQQCGGPLRGIHVGELIKALEFLLPEKAPGQDFTGEEMPLRNIIAVTGQRIMADLIQSGLSLSSSLFVPLISLAGKLRAPELFKQTLDDATTAGITFYAVERRTVLAAAGQIKDRDVVRALWYVIVAAADKEGSQLTYNDWVTFAKACRRADLVHFFEEQLSEQAHAISAAVEKRARSAASSPEPGAAQSSLELMSPEQLTSELDMVQGQMENIRAVLMSGQPLSLDKSPFHMHIDPSQPSLGTEQDLRTVYDELTTDPYQPAAQAPASGPSAQPPASGPSVQPPASGPSVQPPASGPSVQPPAPSPSAQAIAPALSTTGIPLDELRFRNWVSVHEMMSFARAHAQSKKDVIEMAIVQRVAPRDIPETLSFPKLTPAKDAAELRARIKQLRAADPRHTPGQLFRKFKSTVDDGTPAFHNRVDEFKDRATERKIHKHVTKNFAIRKAASETPADVFEPMARDPSTSRWVTKSALRISKVAGYDKYRPAPAKQASFEAYGDGKPGDGKPGDEKPGDGKPGDKKPGDKKPGDESAAASVDKSAAASQSQSKTADADAAPSTSS